MIVNLMQYLFVKISVSSYITMYHLILCRKIQTSNKFFVSRMTFALALVVVWWAVGASAGEPVFDPSTLMRLVLVPADVPVGSVIYRVRASDPDFDYPLHFELIGKGIEFKIDSPK